MNKIFAMFMLWVSAMVSAQLNHINNGEKISYRIHYGFINAGTAELTTSQVNYKGKDHLRVIGTGKSTGIVNTFFKVKDRKSVV